MAGIVTVHYWPSRILNSEAKSLTGHVALACTDVYASWAPKADRAVASVMTDVYPEPRESYEVDVRLAGGRHSTQVQLKGVNVAQIRQKWVGLAGGMAGGGIQGPPIGYRLVPNAQRIVGVSCATLVVQLLLAGGSGAIVPWSQSGFVRPENVYDYASKLAARIR